MDFDEHHVFPKAENEKSYNWSILEYSVFWTERLAGRSPFQQQVISVATDTPLMLELCECPSLIPYVFSFYLIFCLDCFLDQSYIIKFVFRVTFVFTCLNLFIRSWDLLSTVLAAKTSTSESLSSHFQVKLSWQLFWSLVYHLPCQPSIFFSNWNQLGQSATTSHI